MIWLDFFLQALVSALAWLTALTLWGAGLALVVQGCLWIACNLPLNGADPEDYS